MKTTITLLILTIILKCIVAWVGIIPPTETDPGEILKILFVILKYSFSVLREQSPLLQYIV